MSPVCIAIYIRPGIHCDRSCGRFCDGMCDQFKDDVVINEWHIYPDAVVFPYTNGELGLPYDIEKPWTQRLL